MSDFLLHLKNAVENKSSDIFIIAGSSLSEKTEGHIHPIKEDILFPQDTEKIIKEI